MWNNCKYDSSMPFVCVGAYRGIIGSINFTLLAASQKQVRQELQYGIGGIDAYNAFKAELEEIDESDRNTAEQGLEKAALLKEHLGMLRTVREWLDGELRLHAPKVDLVISGLQVPDPWQIGDSIRNTLERMIRRAPRELTAAKKLEAKALDVTEEEVEVMLKRRQVNGASFLVDNKERILEIVDTFHFSNADALSVESILEKLPAMTRLELYRSADTGLHFTRKNEAMRYLTQDNLDSKSNIGILDGERRVLRKEINDFMSDPKVKRELHKAIDGGATLPVLLPIAQTAEEKARVTVAA